MTGTGPRIAIVGAGVGGLAIAASLRRLGMEANVYEQAPTFGRVGAGIMLAPNAMMALAGLGLGSQIESAGVVASRLRNRQWDNGDLIFELPLGESARAQFGAPFVLTHRADLHDALVSAVTPGCIHLDRRLVGIDPLPAGGASLTFENGRREEADLVIGADGLRSTVRARAFSRLDASFTGRVAYRTVYPASLLGASRGAPVDGSSTKWWGQDRHIVIYYISGGREVYFTTSIPNAEWTTESWSGVGAVGEVKEALHGFHPEVQRVIDACPLVNKWAICDRDPLPRWHTDSVVLIGDAAHPMTPYMAQGAAMSLEDAVVLSRCLAGNGLSDPPAAFARYQLVRQARTDLMQSVSRSNTWLSGETEPSPVYGYDAWDIGLDLEEQAALPSHPVSKEVDDHAY